MEHLSSEGLTPAGAYLLGVLGGMGPLASAEFLKTVYECSVADGEQRAPSVVMYSDPTFPDRTDALLGGSQRELLGRLKGALGVLCGWGVSEVVICCVTIHYLLPQVPPHLRQKVASLLDPVMERACEARSRQLMLCTNGARRLGIFEGHGGWKSARRFIVMPEDEDQQRIHTLIYAIKRNGDLGPMTVVVEELLAKYRADGFVAGCTEVHLLSKRFMSSAAHRGRYQCIDPLLIIAERLSRQMRQAPAAVAG